MFHQRTDMYTYCCLCSSWGPPHRNRLRTFVKSPCSSPTVCISHAARIVEICLSFQSKPRMACECTPRAGQHPLRIDHRMYLGADTWEVDRRDCVYVDLYPL